MGYLRLLEFKKRLLFFLGKLLGDLGGVGWIQKKTNGKTGKTVPCGYNMLEGKGIFSTQGKARHSMYGIFTYI